MKRLVRPIFFISLAYLIGFSALFIAPPGYTIARESGLGYILETMTGACFLLMTTGSIWALIRLLEEGNRKISDGIALALGMLSLFL